MATSPLKKKFLPNGRWKRKKGGNLLKKCTTLLLIQNKYLLMSNTVGFNVNRGKKWGGSLKKNNVITCIYTEQKET
jgi:hypothetical protein